MTELMVMRALRESHFNLGRLCTSSLWRLHPWLRGRDCLNARPEG